MASQEAMVDAGLSHLVRWLWAATGVVGGLFFLALTALLGIASPDFGLRHPPMPWSVTGQLTQDLVPWRASINRAAQSTGVPAPWIAAEILVESRGDPTAGSLGGAYGLMQLEPGTMGLTDSQRANPTTNIQAGAMYLASLYRLFHSWREASAAYYGGPGLVLALLPQMTTTWAQARAWLQVVPNPGANSLTLAQYADEVATLAAQLQSHNSP